MKRAGAVLCIVFGSVVAIALALDLLVSILHRKSFSPWWFWLTGTLAVGILGIVAGSLIAFNRSE